MCLITALPIATAHATLATSWPQGSWRCDIASSNRRIIPSPTATMKWTLTIEDEQVCSGNSCTTKPGKPQWFGEFRFLGVDKTPRKLTMSNPDPGEYVMKFDGPPNFLMGFAYDAKTKIADGKMTRGSTNIPIRCKKTQ